VKKETRIFQYMDEMDEMDEMRWMREKRDNKFFKRWTYGHQIFLRLTDGRDGLW
jgi:hypothetical protein